MLARALVYVLSVNGLVCLCIVRLLSLAVVQHRHILTSGGQSVCRVSSGAFSPFNKSSQVKSSQASRDVCDEENSTV